jgi:putative tricarboxylic transport membrane protein
MPKLEKITCLMWLGLGGFIVLGSIKLQFGSLSEPGPGFLPILTGVLICATSLAHLGQLFLKPADPGTSANPWAGVRWHRGAMVVGGLVAYALTVDYLGYLIATFLLMLVLFSLYDRKRWWMAIGGSLMVITVTYLVFCIWLKVQFPAGILSGLGV